MRRKNRNAWKKRQNEYNSQQHYQPNIHYQANTHNYQSNTHNYQANTLINCQDNTQFRHQAEVIVEQKDSVEKVTVDSENITLIDTNSSISGEVTQANDKEDAVVEQDLQGKSTGIDPDQPTNNIDNQTEIENDNVQGSAPSPKANDENVQCINDNTVTNEADQEVTNESTPASESQPIEESDQSKNNQNENNETQEEVFQSEYANEQDISNNDNNTETETQEDRSHTPELKPKEDKLQEKKRITLKRSPPIQKLRRPSSPLEDGEIKEPQEKSKKITLKRHTTDESNSDFINKIVINRRPSGGEEKTEKRLSAEEKTHIVVGRPTKPAKPVKLNRHVSSTENEESVTPPRNRRLHWGKSDWLENISATTFKVDMETIKIVCPTVEFLDESELKLETIPKERTKSENEVVKNKIEEEDKMEEESEKEQSEEEDSTEEQKIEANPNIIALNRKISIVDDTAAKMRPPPSPAKKPLSETLYITNLVRPFTLKQLRELLERTGKIKDNGFWTDKIKSKCYVQYETVEEAETTRNALHGVYWPIGNGKQLVIEYATEEEMDKAKNPVPLPIVPEKLPEKENREPEVVENRRRDRERERNREHEKEERRREPSEREWNKSREEHRKKSSRSRSRSRERVRKHSRRSYTPEDVNKKKHKKTEDLVPQKLMDDLFLKTKTTPSIYWQPLSPQEIATKQQQRLVRMEEHKRRIEENRGRFRDRDRRGTFRRR